MLKALQEITYSPQFFLYGLGIWLKLVKVHIQVHKGKQMCIGALLSHNLAEEFCQLA